MGLFVSVGELKAVFDLVGALDHLKSTGNAAKVVIMCPFDTDIYVCGERLQC